MCRTLTVSQNVVDAGVSRSRFQTRSSVALRRRSRSVLPHLAMMFSRTKKRSTHQSTSAPPDEPDRCAVRLGSSNVSCEFMIQETEQHTQRCSCHHRTLSSPRLPVAGYVNTRLATGACLAVCKCPRQMRDIPRMFAISCGSVTPCAEMM